MNFGKFDKENDNDTKDFDSHLKEAVGTDLTDLERSGCFSQGRDLKNNHLIIMIPSLGLRKTDKPEQVFKRMLLLFIRKSNEIVGSPYSVVYAHTSLDIINQYPLIYKFYSILPRAYKKNLQTMYILHPNYGIKMFFEFARVFLSQKFYNKLCLIDSILEFQKIIPPTLLALPNKFLREEDEARGLKYYGNMAALEDSFDPKIGATKLFEICTAFIRKHGILQTGIFRIPGDECELSLAKVRLQYSYSSGGSDRVVMSANGEFLLIGDLDSITQGAARAKGHSNGYSDITKLSSSDRDENQAQLPEELPASIAIISNVFTVATVFKLAIRDLPKSLIPVDIVRGLIDTTKRFESQGGLGDEWENQVASILSQLAMPNLSTLIYIISFLREVASKSDVNSMDAQNLSIVFAPTLFNSETTDQLRALAEVTYGKTIIKQLILRKAILHFAITMYKEGELKVGNPTTLHFITENPVFGRAQLTSKEVIHVNEARVDAQKQHQVEITSKLTPTMLGRISRGREENRINDVHRHPVDAVEEGDNEDSNKGNANRGRPLPQPHANQLTHTAEEDNLDEAGLKVRELEVMKELLSMSTVMDARMSLRPRIYSRGEAADDINHATSRENLHGGIAADRRHEAEAGELLTVENKRGSTRVNKRAIQAELMLLQQQGGLASEHQEPLYGTALVVVDAAVVVPDAAQSTQPSPEAAPASLGSEKLSPVAEVQTVAAPGTASSVSEEPESAVSSAEATPVVAEVPESAVSSAEATLAVAEVPESAVSTAEATSAPESAVSPTEATPVLAEVPESAVSPTETELVAGSEKEGGNEASAEESRGGMSVDTAGDCPEEPRGGMSVDTAGDCPEEPRAGMSVDTAGDCPEESSMQNCADALPKQPNPAISPARVTSLKSPPSYSASPVRMFVDGESGLVDDVNFNQLSVRSQQEERMDWSQNHADES